MNAKCIHGIYLTAWCDDCERDFASNGAWEAEERRRQRGSCLAFAALALVAVVIALGWRVLR